jgi:NAD(P)-dependent dehydrogenase (short-subunit alcohol dehydrogenase family)
MSDFAGRVVVVTGAAGALGRVVADEFARRGATLALIDILKIDGPYASYVCDLSDLSAVERVVVRIRADHGKIDALVNIAGGFTMGETVHETKDATWQFMFELNAKSVLNMARAVVPEMIRAKYGRIVNIGARAGLRGGARMAAYSASKSTVIRLTESLAEELKGHGINVNCVLPSVIDTPRNRADMPDADFSKWVQPADLARVIAFLASDDARAIHGAAIPVEALA